ncbi:HAMP domain-containing histidine kinase [Actinomadura sp. ATCC 31491]|uniref:histidine kinase n=1 Tax=Actinomadura luzonensis TaxID=2805427 RepID=A0ABT0FZ01_9ACTN|nr:HAMP domain-containing sensor histidine kinase [Actinomadura luzonensis]MCK2217562.1 HAMP domain-containing histidine kinase [Actinomadura luzonensis]
MISPHSSRKATRVQEAPPPSGPPVWDGPPPPRQPVDPRTPKDRMRSITEKVSIRWRLTLTYGALVFVASVVLLFSVYSIVATAIDRNWPDLNWSTPRDELIWRDARQGAVAAAQDALLRSAVLSLVGVGILSLIIGYFVSDRVLRPVARMTATARRLSESTLAHQRIALEGPNDELKELADTFDAMLTRLNVAFDTQRRFVANASHELRTPLTINRTVLEIALSDPEASEDLKALGRTLLEVNARNEKLIEGLLLLARSERELAVRKPVNVQEVAQTAVEQLAPFAAEHGVSVSTELVSAPTVGDPVLLERSVGNLLENAVKYNIPENGKVWIRTGMVDGAVVVQVANTGQHVPAYEVNSLFEPFRRLHADRVDSAKGSGLGLSIVRAVVQAHGGNVAAVPRDGGGLVVTIRLPKG